MEENDIGDFVTTELYNDARKELDEVAAEQAEELKSLIYNMKKGHHQSILRWRLPRFHSMSDWPKTRFSKLTHLSGKEVFWGTFYDYRECRNVGDYMEYNKKFLQRLEGRHGSKKVSSREINVIIDEYRYWRDLYVVNRPGKKPIVVQLVGNVLRDPLTKRRLHPHIWDGYNEVHPYMYSNKTPYSFPGK